MGVAIVQAPGAWSRMGPTWNHPEHGWFCFGPGIQAWNTEQGLAELAVSKKPAPAWHATALACAPEPNIVFLVLPEIAEHHLGGLEEEVLACMRR